MIMELIFNDGLSYKEIGCLNINNVTYSNIYKTPDNFKKATLLIRDWVLSRHQPIFIKNRRAILEFIRKSFDARTSGVFDYASEPYRVDVQIFDNSLACVRLFKILQPGFCFEDDSQRPYASLLM